MCQHRVGLAGPSSRSFLSARHQQHFVFSYSRQHHGSWQRDYLVHPPESGNYAVTLTATSGSLSHTTMITVESGSGSAGGVVLPDDKLRLPLDYIPTLSLIPVVLAVGTVGLEIEKEEREQSLFSMAARTVIFCHILEGSFGDIDLFRQLLPSSRGYSGYLWRSHRAQ